MIKEWPHNTEPSRYIIDVRGHMLTDVGSNITASNKLVLLLQSQRDGIETKRFRKNVLDAIFDDVLSEHYGDVEYAMKIKNRAIRRFGKKKAIDNIIQRSEILDSWKNRDSRFIPDAYYIDLERKTIVCYEVEDTHPLNPFSIGKYAAAWWTLEYIYWDLHLIAYDIYGNPRIIQLPESEFVARKMRGIRKQPPA